MQYRFTKSLAHIHHASPSLWAVSYHFVINILWWTSINLEPSVSGRQTLPGDCVRGSSAKSSMHSAAVIDSILRAAFDRSFSFAAEKPGVTQNHTCKLSVIQAAEALTKTMKVIWSQVEGISHRIMMISAQLQRLFAFCLMPWFTGRGFMAIFIHKWHVPIKTPDIKMTFGYKLLRQTELRHLIFHPLHPTDFLKKARGYEVHNVISCRSNASLSKMNITLGQSPRLCLATTGLSEMTEGILWFCMTREEDKTGGWLWSHHTADYRGRQRDKSKGKSPTDHTAAL